MIITQTPLRISFFGGGTDFPGFYASEPGCVLSSAIDKYIFVTIKERFDNKISVGYTRTEFVDDIDEVEHDLVRECLRRTGITRCIEINTMADIPSEGSGLGSSSTVTVGLLNTMYTYLGTPKDLPTLAREACEIEIDVLKKPIGVQDQYIAAFGGQRLIAFNPEAHAPVLNGAGVHAAHGATQNNGSQNNGSQNGAQDPLGNVRVESLRMDSNLTRRLNQNLMLFYTNVPRKAESVLSEQKQNIDDRRPTLRAMAEMTGEARRLLENGCLDEFGNLMNDAWQLKKRLASKISNDFIDALYQKAINAGARGGKITGAGGGGFLLLYCNRDRQDCVRDALSALQELPFHLEKDGSKVIFNYRR